MLSSTRVQYPSVGKKTWANRLWGCKFPKGKTKGNITYLGWIQEVGRNNRPWSLMSIDGSKMDKAGEVPGGGGGKVS